MSLKDLPALPSGSGLDTQTRERLERWREELQRLRGFRGDPLDKALTLRDFGVSQASQIVGGVPSPPGLPGPPGPPGPPPSPPDLTPPPTPTGLVANPGLTQILLSWDDPTYTQGGGHARTNVYGVSWTTTPPTFGDAVLLGSTSANLYSHPTNTGTQWSFWIKWESAAGVESTSPAGGTNGVQATTGKIGNVDLNPLIIEAGNLASGAVTAAKLAAGAVDLTKFANGIEPVTIVTGAFPTTFLTKTIFWTDNKLYRWNGSAYIKTVETADIAANAITTGLIAAGAVNAQQIAAGAITTDKLLVTGRGPALNADPNTTDISAWTGAGVSIVDDTTSPSGAKALHCAAMDFVAVAELIPLDPVKNYNLRISTRQQSGSTTTYLAVAFYDAFGINIEGGPSGVPGWPGLGTLFYFGLVNGALPGAWTEYRISFGPGEAAKIPANARFCRVGVLSNWTGSGTQRIANVRLMEKSNADLIVDGSIIATKIAAGAIAVGTAAIQNAAIINAMIGDLSADKINAGTLSAARIATGSLNADKITANTIGADRMVAGIMQADNVLTRGLTVRDSSGTIVLASGMTVGSGNLCANGDLSLHTANIPTFFLPYNNGGISITHTVTPGVGAVGGAEWRLHANVAVSNTFGFYFDTAALAFGGFKANTTYSISFYAAVSANPSALAMEPRWNQAPTTFVWLANPVLTGGFQRYALRLNFGSSPIDPNGVFFTVAAPHTLPSGVELAFSNIQVEQGDVPSGWSAPPLTVNNRITSTNISTYIASAAIGNAQIGSVDAGTINVGTLTAAQVVAGRIEVGAVTAKAEAATIASSIGFSSVSSVATTSLTVLSFTPTVASGTVFLDCWADVTMVVNSGGGAIDRAIVQFIFSINGGPIGDTVNYIKAFNRVDGSRWVSDQRSFVKLRTDLPASSHNIQLAAVVSMYDTGNNLVNCTGSWGYRFNVRVSENKI